MKEEIMNICSQIDETTGCTSYHQISYEQADQILEEIKKSLPENAWTNEDMCTFCNTWKTDWAKGYNYALKDIKELLK